MTTTTEEKKKVYKDECLFCFDTPYSPSGLYVSLADDHHFGLCARHVAKYYAGKPGPKRSLFLWMRAIRTKKEEEGQGPDQGAPVVITRLAINLEGGFSGCDSSAGWEIEEKNEVVSYSPDDGVFKPFEDPSSLSSIVDFILTSDSARKLSQLQALAASNASWDGEVRQVSVHSFDLLQLPGAAPISPNPKDWACSAPGGCDKKDNLWMNLTDGAILCGRRNFDGSGGNGHALAHYQATKYPLCVKLGTITPEGGGDVYSYSEDDMVTDPHLKEHLAHFGINPALMEKTEKSMVEMEIDLNAKYLHEIALLTCGSSAAATPAVGRTGLLNLGNSCYMNAVLQVLYFIPEFKGKYDGGEEETWFDWGDVEKIERIKKGEGVVGGDFNGQMAKLFTSLSSGRYAIKKPEKEEDQKEDPFFQTGLALHSFKNLIGTTSSTFATKQQQDAQDFFLHLIGLVDKTSRVSSANNPSNIFKFRVQDRVVCDASGCVGLAERVESCLPVVIPVDMEKEEEKQQQQPSSSLEPESMAKVDFVNECLKFFVSATGLEGFYSSATGSVGTASKTTALLSFPPVLPIQLEKFYLDKKWTPQKLNVRVVMPLQLDLGPLKALSTTSEKPFPQEGKKKKIVFDQTSVDQLTVMGFSLNASKKAVVKSGNQGPEPALQWLMERMGVDPGLDDPLEEEEDGESKKKATAFIPNATHVATIESMGFTRKQAEVALKATNNDVERALDWIFSHVDDPASMMMDVDQDDNNQACASGGGPSSSSSSEVNDGPPKYSLFAFVSHMGPSCHVGHYVAHIKVPGTTDQWLLFNDEKVSLLTEENIVAGPKDLGYLYFYRRNNE